MGVESNMVYGYQSHEWMLYSYSSGTVMDHWIWYRKLLWSPIRLSKRKLTSCYALHVPRFLLIVAFITLFSFVVFNIPRSSWMNQIILPPFIHPFIHDERGVNEWTNERKNEWTMKEGERHPLLKKRYWPGGITPFEWWVSLLWDSRVRRIDCGTLPLF